MGLQIWLPLNGSIKNQGLSNATLTTSGGSWSTISKIGTKSFTNGTITMDAATTGSIYNNNEMTFAFWFYANAADGTSTGNCIIGNGGMGGSNNRKFAIYNYQTVNDLHWSWQVDGIEGGADGAVTVGGSLNDIFPSYKWTHVCITYKNPTAKIYINGELKATSTGDISSGGFNYATPILNLYASQCVNDLRIYDNCLSIKEVKELAQGLVVHYPLNNNGCGAPNLLGGMVECNKNFTLIDSYTLKGTMGNGDTYCRFSFPTALVSGKTYTLSFDVSGLQKGTAWTFSLGNNAKYKYVINTNGHHVYTFVPLSSDSGMENLSKFLWDDQGQTNAQSTPVTISNIKVEEGSEDSNWCPHTSNANYKYYNIGASIEHDCSGYEYNATKSSGIAYSGGSPRNNCSTVFNNSTTYITTPLKDLMTNLFANQCTINFWVNEASTSSRSIYFGGYNGAGFNIEENGGKFRIYWNGNPNRQVATITANTWQMWTVVIDKATGIITYRNGEVVDTYSAALGTVTTTGTFYLGRDYRAASDDVWFEGKMSDFRIYATALSADDIKELYQVSASIDEDGRVYSSEFRGL